MLDEHSGKAGTFVIDPEKGVRVPIEQYQAEQDAKAANSQGDKKAPKANKED